MLYVKYVHIGAMALWLTGLLFLPRLLAARASGGAGFDQDHFNRLVRVLYFRLATPAAVATVVLGTVLLFDGFSGGWLPLKLALVAMLVLLHLYCGVLLIRVAHGAHPHSRAFFLVVAWLPVLLAAAIVALAAAKPVVPVPWAEPHSGGGARSSSDSSTSAPKAPMEWR